MADPGRSLFIRACRGERVERVPVWFMRQAGRYQPSYRRLRERYTLLELAQDPDLLAQVTVQAVRDLGVDAAIVFSDIMMPLSAMGVDFTIQENVGPIVKEPIRTQRQVEALRPFVPETGVGYLLEGIRRIVRELGDVPLIGFAGAPFTLASYLVEGGPSRTYVETKRLMWTQPDVWRALMQALSAMVIVDLQAQIAAGAHAVQVFDSWAGALSVSDFECFVRPYLGQIFSALKALDVPLIYFGVGTSHLWEAMTRTGATVLGVDWRTPLSDLWARRGEQVRAVQGNLDPARLLAGWAATEQGARIILEQMAQKPGFIFNLGHGVPKETDPAVLKRLVTLVHQFPVEG